MEKERISVLVLEDEVGVAGMLKEAFSRSEKYAFHVQVAENESDYLKKGLDRKDFKVAVVDLNLKEGGLTFSGLCVFLRSREVPDALTVVYTGFANLWKAVRAMQLGANDFVSKAEVPPHELVQRIESMLDERLRRLSRPAQLEKILDAHWEKWHKKFKGQFLILVEDEVVASGFTRLEALLKYNDEFDRHENWPEEPELIRISKDGKSYVVEM